MQRDGELRRGDERQSHSDERGPSDTRQELSNGYAGQNRQRKGDDDAKSRGSAHQGKRRNHPIEHRVQTSAWTERRPAGDRPERAIEDRDFAKASSAIPSDDKPRNAADRGYE